MICQFDLTGLVSISAALDFHAQRVVGMDLDSGLIDSAKENWQEMQGRLQKGEDVKII